MHIPPLRPTHIAVAVNTANIGDDIQSLASSRLWGVSAFVDRENPSSWPADAVVALCGWWSHGPFPLNRHVVVAGFHAGPGWASDLPGSHAWLAEAVRLQGCPALCRDLFTRDLLRGLGIPAEFGGCVTLTLRRAASMPLPEGPELRIDTPTGSHHTHFRPDLIGADPAVRLAAAGEALDVIAGAGSIVTTRLHAWLPALALGVPARIIGIPAEPSRFTGYNRQATSLSAVFAGCQPIR